MRDHPDPRLLERFLRGEASALERRSIVRHMLRGCLQCLEVTRPLWRFGDLPLIPPGHGAPDEEEESSAEDTVDAGDGEDPGTAAEACRPGSRLSG
jgi:hypothetical protein